MPNSPDQVLRMRWTSSKRSNVKQCLLFLREFYFTLMQFGVDCVSCCTL